MAQVPNGVEKLLTTSTGRVGCTNVTVTFHMADHELLLVCLERQFGVCGIALQWFGS